MNGSALQRLADAVKARRAELGLAQGDLASSGGPSVVTVGQIERGQIEQPQPGTLRRLDVALQWPAGTSAGLLAGATTAPAAGPAPQRPVGLGLDDEASDLRPEQVEAVRAVIRSMKPPPESP